MTKDSYQELDKDEISQLEEVSVQIDKDAFKVHEGVCPRCDKRLSKIIVNEELFDGTITIHIIKFRCEQCKQEYLDLDEAQKYDLYLSLKKLEHKPLSTLIERFRGSKKGIIAEV